MNALRAAGSFAALALCAALGSPTVAQTASPSPVPTPAATPKERLVIVGCHAASFSVWPDRSAAPHGTAYPPARSGDAFHVIGGDVLAPNGENLTETTIDTVEPWGGGKHYWIATACIV